MKEILVDANVLLSFLTDKDKPSKNRRLPCFRPLPIESML